MIISPTWLIHNFEIPRKFYVRKYQSKVDSIETGHLVIANLFPEVIKKIAVQHAFLISDYIFICVLLNSVQEFIEIEA